MSGYANRGEDRKARSEMPPNWSWPSGGRQSGHTPPVGVPFVIRWQKDLGGRWATWRSRWLQSWRAPDRWTSPRKVPGEPQRLPFIVRMFNVFSMRALPCTPRQDESLPGRDAEGAAHPKVGGGVKRLRRRPRTTVHLKALRHLSWPPRATWAGENHPGRFGGSLCVW